MPTEHTDPALEAILGGHNIWGFPKHKTKAEIVTAYTEGVHIGPLNLSKPRVHFEATHLGVTALKASVVLSEHEPKNIPVPINIRTAEDAVVSGPLYQVQQTRFGEAFNVTQNIAPWDPATDSIEFGDDDFYGGVINGWDFVPKLKMHTDDFQIVAWKPSNWMPANLSPSVVV